MCCTEKIVTAWCHALKLSGPMAVNFHYSPMAVLSIVFKSGLFFRNTQLDIIGFFTGTQGSPCIRSYLTFYVNALFGRTDKTIFCV